MKSLYALVAFALFLLGGAGTKYWKGYWQDREMERSPELSVMRIKSDFESQSTPLFFINTEEVRQSKISEELVDPAAVLPQTQKYSFKEISQLYHYAVTCEVPPTFKSKNPDLQKTFEWHRYTCGQLKELPKTFFEVHPLMHPSGQSFALLASKIPGSPFAEQTWIKGHWRFFHILEDPCANAACQGIIIPLISKLILSPENLRALLVEESLIETPSQILIVHRSPSPAPSVKYAVYSKSVWDRFIEGQSMRTQTGPGTGEIACLYQEGAVCWRKNKTRDERETLSLALLFTTGMLILAGILVAQIFRKSMSQKRAAKQRTFVLQMLTHEIRTPATSLQLSLETLRRQFDNLPKESQQAFLRICDQTQKLSRIIEASKRYLANDSHPRPLKVEALEVSSVNALFESILEKYGNTVTLKKLDTDQNKPLDHYWLELCVQNLVDNALLHGRPPVVVKLACTNQSLLIGVQDQGNISGLTLDDLAIPFRKGPASGGLGLGLVLVRKIAEAMGGELTLSSVPTTFSLKIRSHS